MLGILVSLWDGLFSGAMLVSGSVVSRECSRETFGSLGAKFETPPMLRAI